MVVPYLRRVLGHAAVKARKLFAVFVVEPLDFEVKVHVIGALTQPVLLMFCETHHTNDIESIPHITEQGGENTSEIQNYLTTYLFFLSTYVSNTSLKSPFI